jgi:hypothetical protein
MTDFGFMTTDTSFIDNFTECRGENFPEALGSILGLKACYPG